MQENNEPNLQYTASIDYHDDAPINNESSKDKLDYTHASHSPHPPSVSLFPLSLNQDQEENLSNYHIFMHGSQ